MNHGWWNVRLIIKKRYKLCSHPSIHPTSPRGYDGHSGRTGNENPLVVSVLQALRAKRIEPYERYIMNFYTKLENLYPNPKIYGLPTLPTVTNDHLSGFRYVFATAFTSSGVTCTRRSRRCLLFSHVSPTALTERKALTTEKLVM